MLEHLKITALGHPHHLHLQVNYNGVGSLHTAVAQFDLCTFSFFNFGEMLPFGDFPEWPMMDKSAPQTHVQNLVF